MSVLDKNILIPESAPPSLNSLRSTLLADSLRLNSSQRPILRVYGESMLPTLWPGDVVEVSACNFGDLKPGEIVLACRNGRLFLHRLVEIKRDGFLLRGDSIPAPDPWFPVEALLGRLVSRSGRGLPGRAREASFRIAGRLISHSDLARRLAFKLHGHAAAEEFGNISLNEKPASIEVAFTEAEAS
jgi:hypothetical protein